MHMVIMGITIMSINRENNLENCWLLFNYQSLQKSFIGQQIELSAGKIVWFA